MQEIRLKRLTLFLLESIILQSIILQKDRIVDISFAAQFNFFIEKYYQDNKELFALLYEPKLLEECLEKNYEILSQEQMIKLLDRYHGFDGYSKLIDEVGKEVDEKLIKLATLFTEYYNSLLELYNANASICIGKTKIKILQ